MNALSTILHAADCYNTHHFFAIDALRLVQTEAGKRLARLLLRHHDRYLTGAIDPDIRFRDFQNHVIHVTEGYWGGAPRMAHRWYDRMQRYLRTDRFSDAAHAAGVLSHYFSDVMQPLHTAVCEREKVHHRPIECSVTESYDAIYRRWKDDEMRIVFQLSDRCDWLGEAMLHGARFANRKRDLLLNGHDIEATAQDPGSGLDGHARAALAEIFGLTITGLARIFERAAGDAEAARGRELPNISLALPTLLAGIDAPWRRWIGSRIRRAERLEVRALIDEFRRTGTLQKHLPVEVDITHRVVQVFHDEQRWRHDRKQRLDSRLTVVRVDTGDDESRVDASRVDASRVWAPRRRAA